MSSLLATHWLYFTGAGMAVVLCALMGYVFFLYVHKRDRAQESQPHDDQPDDDTEVPVMATTSCSLCHVTISSSVGATPDTWHSVLLRSGWRRSNSGEWMCRSCELGMRRVSEEGQAARAVAVPSLAIYHQHVATEAARSFIQASTHELQRYMERRLIELLQNGLSPSLADIEAASASWMVEHHAEFMAAFRGRALEAVPEPPPPRNERRIRIDDQTS